MTYFIEKRERMRSVCHSIVIFPLSHDFSFRLRLSYITFATVTKTGRVIPSEVQDMHTFIFLLCSFGFFMLYNTSKRAKLSAAGTIEKWLQANPTFSSRAGIGLVLTCIIALVWYDGIVIGAFASVLLLMAVSAYIIAIAPFYILKLKHLISIATVCLIIELLAL